MKILAIGGPADGEFLDADRRQRFFEVDEYEGFGIYKRHIYFLNDIVYDCSLYSILVHSSLSHDYAVDIFNKNYKIKNYKIVKRGNTCQKNQTNG